MKLFTSTFIAGIAILGVSAAPPRVGVNLHEQDVETDLNMWYDPRGIYSRCVTERSIALTYDDGPSEITIELLDVLKRHGVKATFFVIGEKLEVPEYAEILKRAFAEGHQIAAHTYTHPDLATLSRAKVIEEMDKTEEIIYKTIGVRVKYFRPPYGSYNENVNEIIFARGYKSILWNLDTKDWEHMNGQRIIDTTMGALAYQNNNPEVSYIHLQHDIHETTVNAQDELITKIKTTYPGVNFLHVDECIGFERGDGYREEYAAEYGASAADHVAVGGAGVVVGGAGNVSVGGAGVPIRGAGNVAVGGGVASDGVSPVVEISSPTVNVQEREIPGSDDSTIRVLEENNAASRTGVNPCYFTVVGICMMMM